MGRSPFITKGLEYVGPTLELIAASTDAFPPAKSVACGALWVLSAVNEFKANQEEWSDFSDYVGQSVACVLAAVAKVDDPRPLEGHLIVLLKTLEDIQGAMKELPEVSSSRSKLRRFGSFVKDRGRINEFKTKLERALAVFNLGSTIEAHNALATMLADTNALNNLMRDLSIRIEQSEERLSHRIEQVERRSNLNLLKRADGASWNPKRTCLPGTRAELIDDVMQFVAAVDPASPHRIQLIIGVVGCGKTSISQSISQRCYESTPSTLASSFVFSAEVEARRTPELLFSTLARDLSSFHPALADSISAAIDEHPNTLSPPLAHQFSHLILRPLSSLSIPHPVTIVIDALDEGYSEELLQILADDCAQLPSNCRLIITSRPDPTIMMHLEDRPHVLVREINLTDRHNLDDIALFARHSLAEIAQKRKLGSTWPGEELSELLIRKAEGLFIWISTVRGFILRCTNPTKQLQRLVEDHPFFDHNSEAKMAELYSTVLAACPWDDEDFAMSYQPLMGTIIALKTPLTPSAIESLLGLDLSVAETLRALSPVLTGITGSQVGERPIQILHESFREFSTRRNIKGLPDSELRYAIDSFAHDHRLAFCTLTVLNRELHSLAPVADDLVTIINGPQPQDIPGPPIGAVSEVLWYSCQFFPAHLGAVYAPEAVFLSSLREFLKTNLSRWLALCAHKGPFQGISLFLSWTPAQRFPIFDVFDIPQTAQLLHNIGRNLEHMHRLEEAFLAGYDAVLLRRRLAKSRPDLYNADLAKSLNALSRRYSYLGHPEGALDASRESVQLYKQLAAIEPAKYEADLATALNSLSVDLSDLGKREEALEASRESVNLRRQLGKEDPVKFNPGLALSLNSLSVELSDLGYYEEALDASQESVALYQQMAHGQSITFRSELARALHNLSMRQSDLGHREEALDTIHVAVDSYRAIAKEQPNTPNTGLAMSFNTLSLNLAALGQRDEALAASREAVGLYRRLVRDRPAASNPDFANSLNTLALRLADLGHPEEALSVAREAVGLYRRLADDQPARYRPDLANVLNTLSLRLADTGLLETALDASRESVSLFQELAKDRPTIFRSDLANAQAVLSLRLSDLAFREEALDASLESVDSFRDLAGRQPLIYNPDLAISLNVLAANLLELGRKEEALRWARESTELQRQLAEKRPIVFNEHLAMSMTTLSNCLRANAQGEEALQLIREAVKTYRALAKGTPVVYNPALARSLDVLSSCLSETGHNAEALEASTVSVSMYRQLAESQQTKFPCLALSLQNLSLRLQSLGYWKEAGDVGGECVELFRLLAKERPAVFGGAFTSTSSQLTACLKHLDLKRGPD